MCSGPGEVGCRKTGCSTAWHVLLLVLGTGHQARVTASGVEHAPPTERLTTPFDIRQSSQLVIATATLRSSAGRRAGPSLSISEPVGSVVRRDARIWRSAGTRPADLACPLLT
jgi:hypothetical protein